MFIFERRYFIDLFQYCLIKIYMKNRDLKRQLDSIFEIKNYEFLLIFNIKKRKKYNIT